METSVSLLERLAGSPSNADWRRLLDLYQPLLRAWLARVGVPDVDGDDLTQEVLLVVFREVGGFSHRGQGSFRAWLRAILVNRLRDSYRGRQHRPTATGDSDFVERLHELESPESSLTGYPERNRLNQADFFSCLGYLNSGSLLSRSGLSLRTMREMAAMRTQFSLEEV
jgi:DNA-directed RNA polymerase specialized sigma24 family protein